MSTATKEFIEEYAYNRAAMSVVGNTIAVLALGMQLLMFVMGLSVFLTTPLVHRKGRQPYIILSFIIMALYAAATFLDIAKEFRISYFSGPGVDYHKRRTELNRTTMTAVSQGLMYLYTALGDGLLLYRCYIIWHDVPWVIVLPSLIYLSFIGISIAKFTRLATKVWGSSEHQALVSQQISITYSALTAGLNLIATVLIAYKIIQAQRTLSKALPGREMGRYSSAARLVIESAIPLTIFGLFDVIFSIFLYATRVESGLPNIRHETVVNMAGILYFSFAALSPQMIILRVTTGRSHIRRGDFDSSFHPRSRPLGSLAFNHAPAQHLSSIDDSLTSRAEEGHVSVQESKDSTVAAESKATARL
ncbi:hypothetical protein CC1G_08962 [Coprinopsis cinerea okayama7|uniref:Uncharacterized protein n=1 Tax=Coprinopsis cinerea (strain Okayama-7 / 130 / ATCC MYA-4618 / FGSC 9003) TaxID=240176 RepID=A8P4R9_COPC7|nr:hypothetical protein CC1G_08962 [Coprinopsis cinerea okayama7\|eukprot:XP_001838798.1 hypothetical protein CC1G_08962 [Coprinopsis cinerea okayama7\